MGKLLKNIGMAAVIGFTVGALLSLALPTLAAWSGANVATAVGEMANPLWLGAFAAGWGAIGAAVTPAVTYLVSVLSGKKPAASHDITTSIPAQTITNGKASGLELDASSSRFQESILSERSDQAKRELHNIR